MDVLVVEDDDALRLAFCEALEEAGCVPIAAASEGEALERLHAKPVDLVILDLLIDGKPSIGIAEKANFSAPGADVIVVTGTMLYPFGELHRAVPNISWTLRKPVNLHDLISLVKFSAMRQSQRTCVLRGETNA